MFWAWFLYFLGRAVDIWTTYEGLVNRMGIREKNPIFRYAIKKLGVKGALILNGTLSFLLAFAFYHIPPAGLWLAVVGAISIIVGISNWETIKHKPKR